MCLQEATSSISGEDGDVNIESILTDDVKKALEGYAEWEFDIWKVRFHPHLQCATERITFLVLLDAFREIF